MSWVIDNSRHSGSALLLLLMIANHARSDGTNAFPTVRMLAAECRMDKRQIVRLLRDLERSGELIISHGGRGRGQRNQYAVAMAEIKGDKMSPLDRTPRSAKGDIQGKFRVTSEAVKGDISGQKSGPYKVLTVMNRHEPSNKAGVEPERGNGGRGGGKIQPVGGNGKPDSRHRSPLWKAIARVCAIDPRVSTDGQQVAITQVEKRLRQLLSEADDPALVAYVGWAEDYVKKNRWEVRDKGQHIQPHWLIEVYGAVKKARKPA